MTENESKYGNIAIIGGGRGSGRTLKAHLDILQELEEYRAIGTVEEIKSYFNDNRKAGYKHGYSKAIDEFMSRVKKAYETMESIPTVEKATVNTIMLGIAEEMKAGGENENSSR